MLIIDYSGAANAAAMTTDVNRNKYNKTAKKPASHAPGSRSTTFHVAALPFPFFWPNLW
ncbi:hypothetical protein J2X54_000415 [Duganella sp. 3397]|uniref:hypothetical protein n=1 Tax=Duganella sp. 3397 TaxID=2817732 RepID=UPI00285F370F|nr:hypothetical protein [Duganella sp. 3397]MDR7047980.1 hypothetical protein [Duganella sp. 3397]